MRVRCRPEQGPGIGVLRRFVNGTAVGHLDDAAEVHDGDAVAEVFHHSQVVRDEEVGEAEVFLEVVEKIENLRLNGNIQSADWFVAHDKFRGDGQGAGDADTLTLSPGKFMGVTVGVFWIQTY